MIQDLIYIGWPIVLPLMFVVISLFLIFRSMSVHKNFNTGYSKTLNLTLFIMLLIWSASWGLYMAAITMNENTQTDTLEKIFRSAVSAIGLFAFSIDSNVFDGIPEHCLIKDGLSIMAFFAGICTIVLAIVVVFKRFYASIKLWAVSRFNYFHRSNVYFFWGWNQQSKLLADSIRKHHENDGDFWIVIAEPNLLADSEDTISIQDSLTKLFTHKRSTLQESRRSHSLVAIANADLPKSTHNRFSLLTERSDILDQIGLESVSRLVAGDKTNTHIFFLSDNEDYNVACVGCFSKESINDNGNVTYYCRARKNDLYKTIEDLSIKNNMTIELIDTSHLSIETLKRDATQHPVNLVAIDDNNPTTVSDDFVSLIIGFDSTGRDALRFLYEYGCFVDSSSSNNLARRSPFHCSIVDKDIATKATPFKVAAPSAVEATNMDGTPLLYFVENDYNSKGLYDQVLSPIAKDVNAIFIAVGNNKEGAALCIRLLKYIRQRRSDLSKLRIYVRCYSSEQEELVEQVAKHYNEGCGQSEDIIVPFGKEADLFSYKQIIDTEFRDKGKVYQEAYARLRGEHELWDLRHDILTGKEKYDKDDKGKKIVDNVNGGYKHHTVPTKERIVTLNDLSSLRRKEHQDESNALHALTKMYLLHQSLPDINVNNFLSRYFILDEQGMPVKSKSEGFGSSKQYQGLTDKENAVIHNLAVLEHLRWNASHELLGYIRATEGLHSCDERTMQHNCLRNWQELDAESRATAKTEGWDADYISYDFSVVDTTIKMNLKR